MAETVRETVNESSTKIENEGGGCGMKKGPRRRHQWPETGLLKKETMFAGDGDVSAH